MYQIRFCIILQLGMAFSIAISANASELSSDIPPPNPFMADSPVTTYHANSAQTGAISVPVPRDKTRRIAEKDIIWKPLGPGDGFSIQYSGVYPGGRRVGWFGGVQQLVKLDAETLDVLASYSLGEGEFWLPEQIERHFARGDQLEGPAVLDLLVRPLTDSMEQGIQGVYRLLDKNNDLFMLQSDPTTGDQYIYKFGDAVDGKPDSRIALKGKFKLEGEEGEPIYGISLNLTYDGTLIVATSDGTLFAVSRDFRLLDRIRLPGREPEVKEFMNAFIRNAIAIDDEGGIFVLTRTNMQRVQWTGRKLSLESNDGAWVMSYDGGERGSGTTPVLLGWGAEQDKMVVISDSFGNVLLLWRDKIPDDWAGLGGKPRRVAGTLPIDFGFDLGQPIVIENAMVAMGNGVFVANEIPVPEVRWQGNTILEKSLGKFYGSQIEGTGSETRGGVKWEWDSKTRTLKQAWTTPLRLSASICAPNVNGLLYCIGKRGLDFTIEALDWETGEPIYHYLLGSSYRFIMTASTVSVAPNGDLECGCGGGYGVYRVRTPKGDR